MKTLEEMNSWDYKTAYSFFEKNAYLNIIPESVIYLNSLPIGTTADLRSNYESREIILRSISSSTLILIDGASGNGKTTFGKRLSKFIGAELIDIDILCIEAFNQLISKSNKKFGIKDYNYFDEYTDEYLLDNLESIIARKSESGKPVILVGLYLEPLYRAVISKTLGKYFKNIVSIFCCEKTFKKVEKMLIERNKKFFSLIEGFDMNLCKAQYMKAIELIENNNSMALGLGMDYSYVIDSTVSDLFKNV